LCEVCYRRKLYADPTRRERHDALGKSWRQKNRAKNAANTKKWYDDHRDSQLEKMRTRRTGVSPEVFNAMKDAQNGACAICGGGPTAKNFHVDHCHESGRIRGLLCSKCNTAIGQLQDDPEICERAAEYLRRTHSPKKEEPVNV
jgi:hypothetical protein